MNIIEAENLSKRYTIFQKRSSSIKEMALKDWFRPQVKEHIWALDNISFTIEKGVTLGIIGANGSGKSTLLKIISGITPPTKGEVRVKGTVASLLELGAGFHPELTGMENIYLNASVLKIPKKKIDSVLDEIISFAELEDFIYLPVKHYSSGMLMRLGFSVAAFIDADILILDEVMAVGDTYFKEKSSQKIFEFKQRGKTILLVTHNLEQAERVSDQILWLDSGKTKVFGKMGEALIRYMREFYNHKLKEPPLPFNMDYGQLCQTTRMGSGEVIINKVVVTDESGREVRTVFTGKTLIIEIHYTAEKAGMDLEAVLGIGRFDGVAVLRNSSGDRFNNCPKQGVIKAIFSPLLIKSGRLHLSVALNPPGKPYEPFDMHLRFYEFKVDSQVRSVQQGIISHPVRFEILS